MCKCAKPCSLVQVLEGLKGDKNLDTVSAEYEKLLRAVRTSHGDMQTHHCFICSPHVIGGHPRDRVQASWSGVLECADNEKRLGRKCRDLGAELVAATAKVSSALTLSKEDTASILALKKELEKAWKNADASSEKVLSAKGLHLGPACYLGR